MSSRVGSFLGALLCAPVFAQVTQRVDVNSAGVQANNRTMTYSITRDGRFVTLESSANNLVPGDTNGILDVFLRDRVSGMMERVSVSSSGAQGNNGSMAGWLTPDGRYVAFVSWATNLVPGDVNGVEDTFIRDRWLGTTELVSVSTAGTIANNASGPGAISTDGRYVCFGSDATNLAPGTQSGADQVYVRDRLSGTTDIVSVSTGGTVGNSSSWYFCMSDDGRFVAFQDWADNLVPGDTNLADIFVRDRQSGTTERVSLTPGGSESNGICDQLAISGDGRYIAFLSDGTDLVPGGSYFLLNVYVRDRQQNTTELVNVSTNGTPGNGNCSWPGISDDGRFVVFESDATNLVLGGPNQQHDIYMRDRLTGITTRESVNYMGMVGNDWSEQPAMSSNGRYIAFGSAATNLVPGGDNNWDFDGFVRDRLGGTFFTSVCEPGAGGVIACPCSNAPSGPGRGCENSFGTGGAALSASGGTFLSSDSLMFTTSGEGPTSTSLVLQGTTSLPAGIVFGQGVRCVAGRLARLYSKTAVGGSVRVPDFGAQDQQVSVRSAALGDVILAGQSRWYFVYYRDVNVLGGCDAWRMFNATQTGQVTWWP